MRANDGTGGRAAMGAGARALLVGPPGELRAARRALRRQGVRVVDVAAAEDGLEAASRLLLDLVVVAARACPRGGCVLPQRLSELDGDVPVVVVQPETGRAYRHPPPGVYDVVGGAEEVARGLARALAHRELTVRLRRLEREGGEPLGSLLGGGAEAARVLRELGRIGPTDFNVILHIPEGLGDAAAARHVHELSPRAGQAMQEFRVPETAEPGPPAAGAAYGAPRGAPWGPACAGASATAGAEWPRAALGGVGTLFVRGLDRLARSGQALLLRRLLEPGPGVPAPRVIASTAVPPEELLAAGRLPAELFRRLNELTVRVRPLEERPQDIGRMARRYLAEAADQLGSKVQGFTVETMDDLLRRRWPGNAEELRGVVRRAARVARDWVGLGHLGAAGPSLLGAFGAGATADCGAAVGWREPA